MKGRMDGGPRGATPLFSRRSDAQPAEDSLSLGNEPMMVLKHQMSHARRRPFSGVRSVRERKEARDGDESHG